MLHMGLGPGSMPFQMNSYEIGVLLGPLRVKMAVYTAIMEAKTDGYQWNLNNMSNLSPSLPPLVTFLYSLCPTSPLHK